MRQPTLSLLVFGLLASTLACPPSFADSDGKGSGIGGPVASRSKRKRRFGVDPAELSKSQKAERLKGIEKEYESLKRNQDILQVRTRRNRVNFVGDMRYEQSGKFLKKVFDGDRDKRTRVAALVAIGKSGDFEIIQYAVKKCITWAKKDTVYALSIPRMFKNCRHPDAGTWLLTRLSGVKDQFVLAALVEGLGHTGEPKAVPALLKLATKSKYVPVRFEALRALGSCGGKEVVTDLLPMLTEEDWRLRMAAAEGLGRTGEREIIPQIAKLIGSTETPIVVESATEAIGALGGKTAVEPLIECLRVGRLRARNKARHLLIGIARDEFRQKKDYFTDPNAWASWWKKGCP